MRLAGVGGVERPTPYAPDYESMPGNVSNPHTYLHNLTPAPARGTPA